MLLALDIGNSNMSFGLFSGAQLVNQWRIHTAAFMTADELAFHVRGVLAEHISEVTCLSALSTVPKLGESVRSMCAKYWPHWDSVIVGPGIKTGVSMHVDNPKEVGPDRVVNAAAAHARTHTWAIVVDCGTVTCIDVVSDQGAFLGGALCPGIDISVDALALRASALSRVELVPPAKTLGKNTVHALQSGIIYGFAGQIDGIISRLKEENPQLEDCPVYATGGLSSVIADQCSHITEHDPTLTLNGLRIVFDRHVKTRAPGN